MHCTGASGNVPLFQDGGHKASLLQLAAAADWASRDVYAHKSLNKLHCNGDVPEVN